MVVRLRPDGRADGILVIGKSMLLLSLGCATFHARRGPQSVEDARDLVFCTKVAGTDAV